MGATGQYLQSVNSSGVTETVPIYWDKESIWNFASDYVYIGALNTTDGLMYLPALPTETADNIPGKCYLTSIHAKQCSDGRDFTLVFPDGSL